MLGGGVYGHMCSHQHSGCCAEHRQAQKMEEQVEAITSTIQVSNEDWRGSHRRPEKQSASGYRIHLLFQEVLILL